MNKKFKEVYLRTKGILPVQKLHILADAGIISAQEGYPLEANQFQPNSIDFQLKTGLSSKRTVSISYPFLRS